MVFITLSLAFLNLKMMFPYFGTPQHYLHDALYPAPMREVLRLSLPLTRYQHCLMKNLEYMKHSWKNCGKHGQYCLTIIAFKRTQQEAPEVNAETQATGNN